MAYARDIGPVLLTGELVRLEPLAAAHADGLREAVADGRMWDRWYTSIPRPDGMDAEIEGRLARRERGEMIPFTTVAADGTVLGMTTYYDFDPDVPRLEIGYTWNRQSAHGTGTNAESKLLLLTHAFEELGCECVGFRTQWVNHQSRDAIARLGAKQDGVLRAHRRVADGTLIDVVLFSILRSEWPAVRAHLRHRLRRRAAAYSEAQ
ncbi:GNAT family protein [Tsukamurella sp. 8F]|uniref:GNAT family N-acetyltransferase n=1 Tax=unclassified Tsukamurella TaxID=2633480 RepID=UPI0023B9964B|nr:MULTISPECIES: GNAT family protein [unclassified Tsukamurella]MDF0530339.1 GNAT family protein [Tsukamurella sp. 8J]MDF0587636.1 GNAT family protein [Tsukamurella sp. 8F]